MDSFAPDRIPSAGLRRLVRARASRLEAFTIMEIVLTTLFITILSSVAMRSMLTFSEQRKLRSAAVELTSFLQVARNLALSQSGTCTIALSNETGGIFSVDPPTNNACADGRITPLPPLGNRTGSRNLTAEVMAGSGTFPLTFTPEGTIQTGATVLISSSDVPIGAWCVNVQAPLATVRMGWRPAGATDCDYTINQ